MGFTVSRGVYSNRNNTYLGTIGMDLGIESFGTYLRSVKLATKNTITFACTLKAQLLGVNMVYEQLFADAGFNHSDHQHYDIVTFPNSYISWTSL